jgi:hypothetical protein
VLTLGSLIAAAILTLGWLVAYAGQVEVGKIVGNVGVVVLLLTPVAGLVTTWSELRGVRPTHARLAIAVLAVLVLATLIALLPRV